MLRIVDSTPIMLAKGSRASQATVASERIVDVGYCSSKDTFYHGVKLHVVAERRSNQLPLLRRAGLTPGSENDLRALRRVLPEIESGVLCGDKAYCDGPLKERLAETQNLDLLTPVKKEKGQQTLSAADKLYSKAIGRILSANRVAFQLDRRKNGHPTGLEGALLPGTSCARVRSARCCNADSCSQPLIRILYGCVTAAIRGGRDPPAGRLFDRLKAKGKHRKALRSPVCLGLVAIVYGCWSNGERFDPQHKRLKASQEQKAPQEQKRQDDPNESDRDSGTNRDLSAPISQREATQRKKAPCPQKSGSSSERGQGLSMTILRSYEHRIKLDFLLGT
nr:transposase [Salinibacter ruber]